MPPVVPVTVHNPWIANDRVADCGSLATMAATFDKAYTPDGVIHAEPSRHRDPRHQLLQQLQAPLVPLGPGGPADDTDVVNQLNIFGWSLCGSQAGMNCAILLQMGLHAAVDLDRQRRPHLLRGRLQRQVARPGHDDHLSTSTIGATRGSSPAWPTSRRTRTWSTTPWPKAGPARASCCAATPPAILRRWLGYLGRQGRPRRQRHATKSMNMDLRLGEALKRTWESWSHPVLQSTRPTRRPTTTSPRATGRTRSTSRTGSPTPSTPPPMPPSASPRRPPTAAGPTAPIPWPRTSAAPATRPACSPRSNIATFNEDGLTPGPARRRHRLAGHGRLQDRDPVLPHRPQHRRHVRQADHQRHQPHLRLRRRHDLHQDLGQQRHRHHAS